MAPEGARMAPAPPQVEAGRLAAGRLCNAAITAAIIRLIPRTCQLVRPWVLSSDPAGIPGLGEKMGWDGLDLRSYLTLIYLD